MSVAIRIMAHQTAINGPNCFQQLAQILSWRNRIRGNSMFMVLTRSDKMVYPVSQCVGHSTTEVL